MKNAFNKKKYSLVKATGGFEGLYQVCALRDFGDIKKGDRGGYVQGEHNLSHDGNAWIADAAIVAGQARISGNAIVEDHAVISGSVQVSGEATISGWVNIGGEAEISGNTHIFSERPNLGEPFPSSSFKVGNPNP